MKTWILIFCLALLTGCASQPKYTVEEINDAQTLAAYCGAKSDLGGIALAGIMMRSVGQDPTPGVEAAVREVEIRYGSFLTLAQLEHAMNGAIDDLVEDLKDPNDDVKTIEDYQRFAYKRCMR